MGIYYYGYSLPHTRNPYPHMHVHNHMGMRVIIAGSREFSDYDLLEVACDDILYKIDVECILSGNARGADRMGEEYAQNRGYRLELHPANWDLFGKSAGYKRNEEMAECADILIAFWDGTSKGTKHMIDIANRKGLAVFVKSSLKSCRHDFRPVETPVIGRLYHLAWAQGGAVWRLKSINGRECVMVTPKTGKERVAMLKDLRMTRAEENTGN